MFWRALVLLVMFSVLCAWSLHRFVHASAPWSCVQLIGAGLLVVVGAVHLCEAQHWLAFMQWGQPHSAGHYLDFTSALLGLTLFPMAVLLQALRRRRA
jgi:hypothetical protein